MITTLPSRHRPLYQMGRPDEAIKSSEWLQRHVEGEWAQYECLVHRGILPAPLARLRHRATQISDGRAARLAKAGEPAAPGSRPGGLLRTRPCRERQRPSPAFWRRSRDLAGLGRRGARNM